MEHTLIILKPDAIEKDVVDDVLDIIRNAGLTVAHRREPLMLSEDALTTHYAEHADKDFYDALIQYVTSGPAIPAIVSGHNAIKRVRELVGNTIPADADPDTIRGQFSDDSRASAEAEGRAVYNIIHASANADEAKNEMKIWFPELFDKALAPKDSAAMRADI